MIFRREEGKACIRYAHAAFAFPAKPVTHVSEHLSAHVSGLNTLPAVALRAARRGASDGAPHCLFFLRALALRWTNFMQATAWPPNFLNYSKRATPLPGFGKRTNTPGSWPGMMRRGFDAIFFMRSCAARFDFASSVAVIGTCFSRFSYV